MKLHVPRRAGFAVVVALAVTSVVGCKNEGTCEYRFDEASHDGSIPLGLETCADGWVKDACNANALSGATVGLEASGFTFTKGGKCEALGYKECSAGRGTHYKKCPDEYPKSTATANAPPERPSLRPDRPGAPTVLTAPLVVPADAPFRGAATGKIVLQMFGDLQDPFTTRAWPAVNEVLATNEDLKVVFRHNPLPFHKDAPRAHQAAIEAFKQKGNDGFWAMHDLIVENPRALDRATLVGHATSLKLDVPAFEKALDGGTHAARVELDMKVAQDAGIRSAPIFVLDTRIARGMQPKDRLAAFIAGTPSAP